MCYTQQITPHFTKIKKYKKKTFTWFKSWIFGQMPEIMSSNLLQSWLMTLELWHLRFSHLDTVYPPYLSSLSQFPEKPKFYEFSEKNLYTSNIEYRIFSIFSVIYLNNIHAFYNSAKNSMLIIQPRCSHSCDKKLGPIRVGPRIRHWQCERPIMS